MGACMSEPKQASSTTTTTAPASKAPVYQPKAPTPPMSVALPTLAQPPNQPASSNSSPNRTAQSTSNTPPQSAAATPTTNTPLVLAFTPLPTIPTLISPLNNRVLPSTPPNEDDKEAGSDEVSRASEDDSKGGDNIAVAADPNAHSGGDVAYSFWQQIANPQRDRTFRPSQQPPSGRGGNQRLGQTIKATMRATLGGGDIQDTVKLPDGEDLNEWIAVNTSVSNTHTTQIPKIRKLPACRLPPAPRLVGVELNPAPTILPSATVPPQLASTLPPSPPCTLLTAPFLHICRVYTDGTSAFVSIGLLPSARVHFFNAASMIWATCSQFCTPATCPHMTAGRAEYLWKDDTLYKKPTVLPACQYIELLLNWIDVQISDPSIFPVEEGARFPRSFQSVVRNIYKRLFRLYAHLYCTHSDKVRSIGANAHLNTCFKHFMYFSEEFGLIDDSDKQPLARLITKMRENDGQENKYR